jgi:FkbM family methyltransferase
VLIDLGANIGAVTLDFASRSAKLRVYAYEPNPMTNKVLRTNIEVNGLADRVKVYGEAIGRNFGELKLRTNLPSVLVTAYGDTRPTTEAMAVNVKMIDLNEVVRRVGEPITLLKIDTEGAEADILEGADAVTLDSVGCVVLEYHDQLFPEALSRCKAVLTRAGFDCVVYPANPRQGLLYAWHP